MERGVGVLEEEKAMVRIDKNDYVYSQYGTLVGWLDDEGDFVSASAARGACPRCGEGIVDESTGYLTPEDVEELLAEMQKRRQSAQKDVRGERMNALDELLRHVPDAELIERCRAELSALCKGRQRGGKDWSMTIPAKEWDSDVLLFELLNRFERLLAKKEGKE